MNGVISAAITAIAIAGFGFITSLIRNDIIRYIIAAFGIMTLFIGFLSTLNI